MWKAGNLYLFWVTWERKNKIALRMGSLTFKNGNFLLYLLSGNGRELGEGCSGMLVTFTG